MIYAMKYNCESRANLYMSRCSRSFLSMTWGWSHLLQFLLGFFCPGGTPVTRESAAGTLAPWDSVCHVARWHFPKLADSLMATRWPWEVVTKKIRLKLSQWKAVWLIESYGCTYRMLKWGSRWVQHKKSSCGVTWFLPCFTCRCVLISDEKICLQMAMTPCHQCPKTHLQSSSDGW